MKKLIFTILILFATPTFAATIWQVAPNPSNKAATQRTTQPDGGKANVGALCEDAVSATVGKNSWHALKGSIAPNLRLAPCMAVTTVDLPPVITPAPPPVVVPVPPAPTVPPVTTTADADFAARCSATGVTLCKALDLEAEIANCIETANDGTRQGFPDAAVKASGSASLKFTLRKGVKVPNIGGACEFGMGSYAAGSTLYVQYRARFSKEYVANNLSAWGSSIKFINLHGPSSTCQGTEMTTIAEVSTNGQGNRVVMYHDCGNGWPTDPATNKLLSGCSGDCLLQQASSVTNGPNVGYNCHYQNQHAGDGNGEGCFWLQPEKWYTFYEVIKLGAIGAPTSSVYAYVSEGGGPYKQFQRVDGVTRAAGDAAYTRARLETYMTEIAAGGAIDAFVWYDELIVSTQPIAAPSN